MDKDRNTAVSYGGTIRDAAGRPAVKESTDATGGNGPAKDGTPTVEEQLEHILPQERTEPIRRP